LRSSWRVGEDHSDAGVQEGELAVAMLELVEVELDDLEGLRAGQEGDARALLALGRGPTTFSGASASPWRKRM
jgi:hypothetical protein